MKKILVIGCLLGLGLFYSSCDNELDLIADWKDIPIVYGLINRLDTAHYIRVEKAFVDPKVSPVELAQRPDSLYYGPNVLVQLKSSKTGEVFNLSKVDGNAEGHPREDGPFATQPNYLYKLKLPSGQRFAPGETLDLVINRGDNTVPVTASTVVVSNITFNNPSNTGDLVNTAQRWDIEWKFELDAKIFDLTLFVNYEEKEVGAAEWIPKTLTWVVGRGIINPNPDRNRFQRDFATDDFYNFLADNIEANSLVRRFTGFDIKVDAGGQTLRDYIDIGKINTGITSSQVIPTYTNLSEGYGVFSSVNSVVSPGHLLTAEARDSLRDGSITKNLNFLQ